MQPKLILKAFAATSFVAASAYAQASEEATGPVVDARVGAPLVGTLEKRAPLEPGVHRVILKLNTLFGQELINGVVEQTAEGELTVTGVFVDSNKTHSALLQKTGGNAQGGFEFNPSTSATLSGAPASAANAPNLGVGPPQQLNGFGAVIDQLREETERPLTEEELANEEQGEVAFLGNGDFEEVPDPESEGSVSSTPTTSTTEQDSDADSDDDKPETAPRSVNKATLKELVKAKKEARKATGEARKNAAKDKKEAAKQALKAGKEALKGVKQSKKKAAKGKQEAEEQDLEANKEALKDPKEATEAAEDNEEAEEQALEAAQEALKTAQESKKTARQKIRGARKRVFATRFAARRRRFGKKRR